MSNSVRPLYEFEGFRLNPAERLLARYGTLVPLAPKAFEMLVVLVSNSGRLLTKDELMQAVWPDTVVEENNLDKTISALRKALDWNDSECKLIETVRGHGYRFIAPVTEIVEVQLQVASEQHKPAVRSISPPLPQLDTVPTSLPSPVEKRDKESVWRYWRGKRALGLAALLLLAVVVTLKVWPSKKLQPDSPHWIKMTRLTNGGFIHDAVLSPDGKYFAYTEQLGATSCLWLRLVTGGQPLMLVPEIEHGIRGLTFAPDGQAIYFVTTGQANLPGALYSVPLLGGPVTRLLTGIISPVTFAPDGQRLAFIRLEARTEEKDYGSSLVLADITGGNERILRTVSGLERFGQSGISWSPDGEEIACQLMTDMTKTSDGVWRVIGVNARSGAQRMLTAQQWDLCGRLVWLRDGRGIVIIGTKQGESATGARDSVWFISQPDGAVRRLTTDLNRHYYSSLSVSDDGQSLLVIPFNRTSQIWSVEARGQGGKTRYDAHTAVQLTTGTGEGRAGIVSLDDGRIVYVGRTGDHVDLWRMNHDGSQQQQLTTAPSFLEEISAPSDGRYFAFASNRAGYSHLFRVNRDGTDLRQLTSGESREVDSDCSPDGCWIVYSSKSSRPDRIVGFRLWKISAEGGKPISLTDYEADTPRFSPDGKWISYVYYIDGFRAWRVSVIPADGGAPIKTFEPPGSAELSTGCRWTPDGQGLVYIVKGKTFDNLWVQPLNGRAPYPLTDFNSGEIYNYAFTRNGNRLLLAHGYSIRDVSLISDFK
jgi:Tol biopolymer transport system component/DNA-binding winged helix-turn-helix (wHTH) protein